MRLKLVGWKLWYTNSAPRVEFSSRDGTFADAPEDGVIEMVAYYMNLKVPNIGQITRSFFGAKDWYFHDGKELFGSNDEPDLALNQTRYPNCTFKRGIWVSREEMELVYGAALDDKGEGWL